MQVTTSCSTRRPRLVIEHVVDGEQRHAGVAGKIGEPVEPGAVIAVEPAGGSEPDAPAGNALEVSRVSSVSCPIRLVGNEDEELTFGDTAL